jgi:hypothetical protein
MVKAAVWTATLVAAALVTGSIVSASGQDAGEKKTGAKPNRIEVVLEAVDLKARTITVRLGKSIDEALTERLKEAGKKEKAPVRLTGEKKTYPLWDRHVEIYLKFRSSPSVANNVEHQLTDLEKMLTYPAELQLAERDGKPAVSSITVYRGTPWKLVEPKSEVK